MAKIVYKTLSKYCDRRSTWNFRRLSIRLPRSTQLKSIEHNFFNLNSDKLQRMKKKKGFRLTRKHFIDFRLVYNWCTTTRKENKRASLRLIERKCESKMIVRRKKIWPLDESILAKKRNHDSSFCKKEVDSVLYDLNKNVLICNLCGDNWNK